MNPFHWDEFENGLFFRIGINVILQKPPLNVGCAMRTGDIS